MNGMTNVYSVEAACTPFTAFSGSFVNIDAVQLGTAAEALKRAGVTAEEIEHVVYGGQGIVLIIEAV
jgi:acetyl-CoA acyltransferase 2